MKKLLLTAVASAALLLPALAHAQQAGPAFRPYVGIDLMRAVTD